MITYVVLKLSLPDFVTTAGCIKKTVNSTQTKKYNLFALSCKPSSAAVETCLFVQSIVAYFVVVAKQQVFMSISTTEIVKRE
jgi:hypothetical protein